MTLRLQHRHDVGRRWFLADEFNLLIVGAGRREDFTSAEVVQQSVATDGARLLGRDESLDFGGAHEGCLEVRVEFVGDVRGGDFLGSGFSRVPLIYPAQQIVERGGDGRGDAGDDAALAGLTDGKGFGALRDALLTFEEA